MCVFPTRRRVTVAYPRPGLGMAWAGVLGGDGERFQRVMRSVVGKRLTYRVLTAKDDAGFMGIW